MQAFESKYWQEGIDSKALLVCFLQKLPYLLLMGVAGAVLGSGLYLLITVMTSEGTQYQSVTKYYIDFADGRLEAKDYYNAFTWNDNMTIDDILGNTMTILGEGVEREKVGEMITADILSDVRYLTVTVTGSDAEFVGKVSEATAVSLERFGTTKDEFDSITRIEDKGVKQVEEPLFTWRAAVLGALVGFGLGVFLLVADFSLGSKFYTKRDISCRLGIPVFGLLYRTGNAAAGMKQGVLLQKELQEKALQLALQYRLEQETSKTVVLMDALDGALAQSIKNSLDTLCDSRELVAELTVQKTPVRSKEEYTAIRESAGVIMVVPFARAYREAAKELLDQLENQECTVLGAVLADVDLCWMKLYGNK